MELERVATEVLLCPLDEVEALVASYMEDDPRVLFATASRIGEIGELSLEEVSDAFAKCLPKLETLEGAEIIAELDQILVLPKVDAALEWLQRVGFIAEYFPELEACKHLQQEKGRHHKDVWEHTKLVVKQAVPRAPLRWAALLHDIGKVPTRRFTNKGVHFHGHAEVGARMFDKIHKRLPFPEDVRRKVRFLIKYHLRSAQYEEGWTDSAVRRFAKEMEPHLKDLLDLSRADITSKRPGRRRQLLFQIHELSERIEKLRAEDAKPQPLPKGLGAALIEKYQLPPSRRVGALMKAMSAEVEGGRLEAQREFGYYLSWLEGSGLLDE